MTLNPSQAAKTVSPFQVAVYVFAASQIVSIPLGYSIISAAVAGGGCAAYNHMPNSIRGKAGGKYAHAKQLLREHLARASRKVRHATRHVAIRIHRIVANGVLIILIWAAFAGEAFHQFVETVRLCIKVCSGEQVPVFAEAM